MRKRTKKNLVVLASVVSGGLVVCGIYNQWKKGAFKYDFKTGLCQGRVPTDRELDLLGAGADVMLRMVVHALNNRAILPRVASDLGIEISESGQIYMTPSINRDWTKAVFSPMPIPQTAK